MLFLVEWYATDSYIVYSWRLSMFCGKVIIRMDCLDYEKYANSISLYLSLKFIVILWFVLTYVNSINVISTIAIFK